MAKTPDTDVTIEALLEQRTQYEEWLAKLDNSGDKAPPAVRERVRGDYEARLQQVMEQLRGRANAIGEELERQHASQARHSVETLARAGPTGRAVGLFRNAQLVRSGAGAGPRGPWGAFGRVQPRGWCWACSCRSRSRATWV